MNTFERFIIVATFFVIGVMCLFPPWEYTYQRPGISQVKRPAPYTYIVKPPPPKERHPYHGVVIDAKGLLIQCTSVLAFGAGMFLISAFTRKQKTNTVKTGNQRNRAEV